MADDYQDFQTALHRHPGPHQTHRPGVRGAHLRVRHDTVARRIRPDPASNAVSLVRDTPLVLPTALLMIWIWFLITATTNAVNLTDGLDGLAAGASAITFMAYTLLGVWQYGQNCSFGRFERCYDVRDPLDLAVIAAAMAGACVGFLWWNASPAQIFMGTPVRWPWRRDRVVGDPEPYPTVAATDGRAVPDHHAVGDRTGGQLQTDR